MKKLLLFMAIAATGLSACDSRRPQSLTIDNALTADEIATGILTPEVMWKMSRAGSSSLSPDGRTLLYAQTDYNMAENRGVTTIWVEDLATKAVTRLTDTASNNADPKWSADGEKIYFLSDRSGSMQVWEMTPAGGNARQLSAFDKDVEGFGISPRGDKAWYVQRVEVCDRKSSDVYKDMDKSKARIYDDLMARHWNYWDEGSYLHIFVGDFGAEGLKPGVDIIGKDAAWDAPLAPYFDMAEIAWNNAGTMLAYTCKPLTGTEYAVSTDSDIFVYVLENGVTQNICKPVNVNTGEPIADMATMAGYDKYPVWSPDDRQIAFLSQRRAGNESDKARLFLYDCQTAQMQDLTEDFDYNAMNVVWSGSDMLYFIAPIEATHQICRIAPSVGEVEVVTRGDHDINAFSMAGDRIAAEMCTISMATEFFDVTPPTAR
jgi:dipeptidyl aminopeptidases/acylaminoacyl-peptidases